MRTDIMKPCPACGVALSRIDAEAVTRERGLCPRSR